MSSDTDLEAEYLAQAKRAGLTVPEDRLAPVARLYGELRDQAALLRSMDLTAADEPANIYSFGPVLRGK